MPARPAWCWSRPRRRTRPRSSPRSTTCTAGGSTAGAEGIEQAYQLAEQNFDKGGVNRVILATDGDFNVGITEHRRAQELRRAQARRAASTSRVLGFGEGNYSDELMQTLAQNGNGNAAYIDTLNEARKVLVRGGGLDAVHRSPRT